MRHITTHNAPATGLRGIGNTSWHTDAVCHGMDPEDADATFFPLPRDHQAIAEAKELCGLCPVRRDCLNYALENDLKEGVWGGLTAAEREPWHEGLSARLDYSRVIAFFNGRDVHLTKAERQIVVDHAYVRGWRADRLAAALRIGYKHAQELLRQAANKVFHRDQALGVPPNPYKKKGTLTAPASSWPSSARPGTKQPESRPTTSTSVVLGTACGPTPPAGAGPTTGLRKSVPASSGPTPRPEPSPQRRGQCSPPTMPHEDREVGPDVTRSWVQLSFLEPASAHAPLGKVA